MLRGQKACQMTHGVCSLPNQSTRSSLGPAMGAAGCRSPARRKHPVPAAAQVGHTHWHPPHSCHKLASWEENPPALPRNCSYARAHRLCCMDIMIFDSHDFHSKHDFPQAQHPPEAIELDEEPLHINHLRLRTLWKASQHPSRSRHAGFPFPSSQMQSVHPVQMRQDPQLPTLC